MTSAKDSTKGEVVESDPREMEGSNTPYQVLELFTARQEGEEGCELTLVYQP